MEGGQSLVVPLADKVVVMKYNVISTRLTGGCLVLVVNVMTVMWPDSLTYDPRPTQWGVGGVPHDTLVPGPTLPYNL